MAALHKHFGKKPCNVESSDVKESGIRDPVNVRLWNPESILWNPESTDFDGIKDHLGGTPEFAIRNPLAPIPQLLTARHSTHGEPVHRLLLPSNTNFIAFGIWYSASCKINLPHETLAFKKRTKK